MVSFGSDDGARDPTSGEVVGPGEEGVCFILFLYLSVVEGVDENGGVVLDAAYLLSSFFLPRSPFFLSLCILLSFYLFFIMLACFILPFKPEIVVE